MKIKVEMKTIETNRQILKHLIRRAIFIVMKNKMSRSIYHC